MHNTKVILIQGVKYVGKSDLCNRLNKQLYNSTYLSVNKYIKDYCEQSNYDIKKKDKVINKAKKSFLHELKKIYNKNEYDYILVEYTFRDKFFDNIVKIIDNNDICTVYLRPNNIFEHSEMIEKIVDNKEQYCDKIYRETGFEELLSTFSKTYSLPVTSDVLEIYVEYKPKYKLSREYDNILLYCGRK